MSVNKENFIKTLTEALNFFDAEAKKDKSEFDGAVSAGLRAVIESYKSRVKQLTPVSVEPSPEPETEEK